MERMKRIENLNVRGFCAQGIVSADGIIPTCIVSSPAVGCLRTAPSGFPAVLDSSYRSGCSPVCSVACSWSIRSEPLTLESWSSFPPWSHLRERRAFLRHLAPTRQIEWVVYAKRPFAGPEPVLEYAAATPTA
jgi:hypothetical protein